MHTVLQVLFGLIGRIVNFNFPSFYQAMVITQHILGHMLTMKAQISCHVCAVSSPLLHSYFFFIYWFTDPPTQIFASQKEVILFLSFFIASDAKNCQI